MMAFLATVGSYTFGIFLLYLLFWVCWFWLHIDAFAFMLFSKVRIICRRQISVFPRPSLTHLSYILVQHFPDSVFNTMGFFPVVFLFSDSFSSMVEQRVRCWLRRGVQSQRGCFCSF
jgi:hypothetical protein